VTRQGDELAVHATTHGRRSATRECRLLLKLPDGRMFDQRVGPADSGGTWRLSELGDPPALAVAAAASRRAASGRATWHIVAIQAH